MTTRQHLFNSNVLSKTATRANIPRMSPEVRKKYDRRDVLALQDTADVGDILKSAGYFVWTMKELKKPSMESVPELDELGDSTGIELLQIEQANKNRQNDKRLKDSDKTRKSFGARLKEISCTCYDFICTPIRNHFRPRSAQINYVNEDVNAHVALAQEQLTSDVAQLKDFLRGRLFDQYCLMRGTPMEKKDKTWLKYGECIIGYGNSKCDTSLLHETADIFEQVDREVGERLHRMINASGLDPYWVMDHIEDYHNGNEHIGEWQRYVQSRRWMDLAEKFTKDIRQLQRINSTRSNNSRRCKIMVNIHDSKRMFFKRLDGPRDYELSDKALRMMEESYASSSTSSSDSSWTTPPVRVSESF